MTLTEEWAEQALRDYAVDDPDTDSIMDAALALACFDAPVASLDSYRHHLDILVQKVAAAGTGVEAAADRAAVLSQVVFAEFGYGGDSETYDDLQNANLIRVIDRRKGLPVALGVLLIHLARQQGWSMWGLDFPGHFLLRLDGVSDRAIIDPFHAGIVLDTPALRGLLKVTLGADAELEPAHYQQVTDFDVLLRLQNNIKIRLVKDRRVAEALNIVDTMLILAPDNAVLWRESGLMNAHIGNTRTAIEALETYASKESRDAPRREAAGLIAELRAKLS